MSNPSAASASDSRPDASSFVQTLRRLRAEFVPFTGADGQLSLVIPRGLEGDLYAALSVSLPVGVGEDVSDRNNWQSELRRARSASLWSMDKPGRVRGPFPDGTGSAVEQEILVYGVDNVHYSAMKSRASGGGQLDFVDVADVLVAQVRADAARIMRKTVAIGLPALAVMATAVVVARASSQQGAPVSNQHEVNQTTTTDLTSSATASALTGVTISAPVGSPAALPPGLALGPQQLRSARTV